VLVKCLDSKRLKNFLSLSISWENGGLIYYMDLTFTIDNLSYHKQTNPSAGCTSKVLISVPIYTYDEVNH